MCNCSSESLIPKKAVIKDIRDDTDEIKTFQVTGKDGNLPFSFKPGQCAMLSLPPAGEAIFSITSSPDADVMEFSIKKVGDVTEAIHNLEIGSEIGIRGPYGNGFPVDKFENKDLLFIGGGIGLAPLHSVIEYARSRATQYGNLDIVAGSRSPQSFVHQQDLFQNYLEDSNTEVYLTVDKADESWTGAEGFVPQYLDQLDFKAENRIVIVCGPPIMIKFVLEQLKKDGFQSAQVYTTLELKMKCGVGKCGRCNLGSKYVCIDGPVFTAAELEKLPDPF